MVTYRTALIATLILAFACFVAAFYHVQFLVPLLNDGKRANAVVSDIHRGARNTKFAIYTFTTESGQVVTAKDRSQMYFKQPKKGEELTVIYDPFDPGKVTADLGIWTWQGVAIFSFGFVFFIGLGTLIMRFSPADKNKD